uniref:Uncharacterized protein n=1 Tax=Sphaerodactylus townsendi TaxID=933632 RepID=A0ACB8FXX1_9SAUR
MMSGQSITDRITAAQHSVTGSAIAKAVCKATTHEVMGPKKKHLDSETESLVELKRLTHWLSLERFVLGLKVEPVGPLRE